MLISYYVKNAQIKDDDKKVLAMYYYLSQNRQIYIKVNLMEIYAPGIYALGNPGYNGDYSVSNDSKNSNGELTLYGYKKDIISQKAGNTHRKNKTKKN